MALYRMTDEELTTFVRAWVDGLIFSTAHMPEHELKNNLGCVFMPLIIPLELGEDAKDVGLIWEYLSKAGSRSINGMPMFVSCNIMHKDDWAIARDAINDLIDQRKAETVKLKRRGADDPERKEPGAGDQGTPDRGE